MHMFHPLLFRYVPENRRKQVLAMFAEGPQGHLQENLPPAEISPGKLHRHSLLPRVEMPSNFSQMRLIKVVRQEQGKVLTQQLFRRRPKGLLGDRIDKENFASFVNDDDGI